jgi:hypothetical protein
MLLERYKTLGTQQHAEIGTDKTFRRRDPLGELANAYIIRSYRPKILLKPFPIFGQHLTEIRHPTFSNRNIREPNAGWQEAALLFSIE